MSDWVIGVIGGSGLYDIKQLERRRPIEVDTPWGRPSSGMVEGEIDGRRTVFLPRHGLGHVLSPSAINYRANIAALKLAGCTDLLSLSAAGSLREEHPPGSFVFPDQFIDRTQGRQNSFFGTGMVSHVSLADPICPRLSGLAADAATAAGADVARGGTYLAMEGPQFSTRAESRLYRSWGCDVIGMTNFTEARLAREAELPYASVAMVTDYDSWREHEGPVDVTQIVACLHANAERARNLVVEMVRRLPSRREPSPIDRALDGAFITAPAAQDRAMKDMLSILAPRFA